MSAKPYRGWLGFLTLRKACEEILIMADEVLKGIAAGFPGGGAGATH